MHSQESFDAEYGMYIDAEANRTLRRAGFWAAVLGYVCTLGIGSSMFAGATRSMEVPLIWAFICGLYCTAVYLLARAGSIRGVMTYGVVFGFVSLPSVIYVLSFFLLESGTATYITGPPSYLYFAVVILSGFALNPRLTIFAGLVGSLQYTVAVLLAGRGLQSIQAADPLLRQDLVAFPIYAFKCVLLFFCGIFMGTFANTARRLIARIRSEEREKSAISGLFGQYVSEDVKDRIISEKSGTIGELRMVAVLFCDIRGFTAFSERNSPADVVTQLNEYFDVMVDAIALEQGTVDKFIGDAVMAYFGGLVALEGPCNAAFRSAVGMRRGLSRLNQLRGERGLSPIENGIGLHFGEVLQGTIGSEDRKNFSIIGDSVNTAARIEGLCGRLGKAILVSEGFYAELGSEERALCRPVGPERLKGKEGPLQLYEIVETSFG